jgi:hypothetical protein
MLEPNKMLMRFLMAARSSLVTYTARASSMNFAPKRPARSSSRMSSSMTHKASLTRVRLASSLPRSTAAAPESFQTFSSRASSWLTLATFAASLMRAALMRKIVILSSKLAGADGYQNVFHGCGLRVARLTARRASRRRREPR